MPASEYRSVRRFSVVKRFILIASASLIIVTALAGCALAGDRLNIIATIFAPYDLARVIAGDRADVAMLISPGAESHSFEPAPQDIITIMSSDVFIYVGGDSDSWVDRLLGSMNTEQMKIISLMECVDPVGEEIVEGMEHDRLHDHDHHDHDHDEGGISYDEHVWTSPKNAMLIVRKIADALCGADERNADFYRQNAAAYIEKLEELDAAFQAVVDGAVRNTVVFGDRFPFRYFADAYGLEYFAAFPGCSTETEPSARTVAFLIDKVKAEKIPVIFHIELSNEKMADTISEETGAKKRLLHSSHNITRDDFQKGFGYLDLMTRNIEALREALH